MKFLDGTGLAHLWSKIKIYVNGKVPTKVSQLTNDSGFITEYTETDPTVPSHVKSITQANITAWNNKAEKSDIPNVDQFIEPTSTSPYKIKYIWSGTQAEYNALGSWSDNTLYIVPKEG